MLIICSGIYKFWTNRNFYLRGSKKKVRRTIYGPIRDRNILRRLLNHQIDQVRYEKINRADSEVLSESFYEKPLHDRT